MDNGRNASPSSGNSVDAAAQGSSVGSASSRPRPAAQNGSGAAHAVIKCPRCDSHNTKFCYYNNYSELQPRHFCKSCRRYWTNGGALRNVPVGGGCRKNKRLKQRPLLSSTGGLLDPSSFMDETTSNMLARLSTSSPPFPNFTGPSNDNGNHLFNLMFSPLRLAQSSDPPGVAPYLDVGFPGLVHMKHAAAPHNCLCGACGGAHHTGCGGVMGGGGLEGNLGGFGILDGKGEHDVSMTGFCNGVRGGYELSSLYHDRNTNMHMLRTSATATLDSLEDQLSSFSNLQQGDAFDAAASGVEQKSCGSMEDSENEMGVDRASHTQQLAGPVNGTGKSLVESAFNVDIQAERDMMDERPLVSRIVGNNELSLLMSMDNNNWQQPPLMMGDLLMEPQTDSLDLWNPTLTNPRWQEHMHYLAAPSATAAGSVL